MRRPSAEGAIQSRAQKRFALPRVENGFDHIEGGEIALSALVILGSRSPRALPEAALSLAPLALKISSARIVLPLFPGLPYVGVLSLPD